MFIHEHDFHQLVMPVCGMLKLQVGQSAGVVDEHCMGIIPAGTEHCFEGMDDNQFIVADIPTASVQRLDRLPSFIDLDETLARYISFLSAMLANTEMANQSFANHQMSELLIQLLSDRYAAEPLIDMRVLAAKRYLEQHFNKNVTQQNWRTRPM